MFASTWNIVCELYIFSIYLEYRKYILSSC